MADRTHEVIRQAGGIVHGDGNIFFTDHNQFAHAASVFCGTATEKVDHHYGSADFDHESLGVALIRWRESIEAAAIQTYLMTHYPDLRPASPAGLHAWALAALMHEAQPQQKEGV